MAVWMSRSRRVLVSSCRMWRASSGRGGRLRRWPRCLIISYTQSRPHRAQLTSARQQPANTGKTGRPAQR